MKKAFFVLALLVSAFFCKAQNEPVKLPSREAYKLGDTLTTTIPSGEIIRLTDTSYVNFLFKIMNKLVSHFPYGMRNTDEILITRGRLGDEKEYIKLTVNGLLLDAFFVK